jgi:hypothetical protein
MSQFRSRFAEWEKVPEVAKISGTKQFALTDLPGWGKKERPEGRTSHWKECYPLAEEFNKDLYRAR